MHARRGDPEEGYLVVQQMVEFLRDAFDKFASVNARGSSTIIQGNTSVGVSFASAVGAIYSVAVTPIGDPGSRFWVSGKSSGGFTINLQTAAPVGGVNFDWLVRGA
jgi:hypothetical protein